MKIGVPKEIKNHEYRVGLTPASVQALVRHGHQVFVQQGAAAAIGFLDDDYRAVDAVVVDTAEEVFASAELIVKVKEPQENECRLLTEQHVLFTFLHLAPNYQLTESLLASGCVAIAYETVTDAEGYFPILAPMSEIAGRMSVQAGAHCLEMQQGGRGVLLSGSAGVAAAKVLILGCGIVGSNAASIAVGMGANVTIADKSTERLVQLEQGGKVKTLLSSDDAIAEHIRSTDLLIGAAMVPGAMAPRIVSEDMIKSMNAGAVAVDVAIDQGGCFATSRPTTHAEPTFVEHDVIHYCVSNIPGAVARTSTLALNAITLPYVIALAGQGAEAALKADPHLRAGLNIFHGKLTYAAIAQDQDRQYTDASTCI